MNYSIDISYSGNGRSQEPVCNSLRYFFSVGLWSVCRWVNFAKLLHILRYYIYYAIRTITGITL